MNHQLELQRKRKIKNIINNMYVIYIHIMALRLLLSIGEEVLGAKPWHKGDVATNRQGKCDGTGNDDYDDVDLYGDVMPVNHLNNRYDKAKGLIDSENKKIAPIVKKIEDENNAKIKEMYEEVKAKFEAENNKKIDDDYTKKYDELDNQYKEMLAKLEEEYQKAYGEEQDKFYKAEDTKIEKEKAKKKEFDAEQNAEVAMRNAGSMFKLYLAGGMFAAFLLISLILVLVKIERNLRSTKIEEIVEA